MVGVSETAIQLGLPESQIYDWRRKQVLDAETSQVEVDQAVEIARIKCQLAEQAEELAIVIKAAVDSMGQRNAQLQMGDYGGV